MHTCGNCLDLTTFSPVVMFVSSRKMVDLQQQNCGQGPVSHWLVSADQNFSLKKGIKQRWRTASLCEEPQPLCRGPDPLCRGPVPSVGDRPADLRWYLY